MKFFKDSLPRTQLIVAALLIGTIGTYLIVSSRAAVSCDQTVSSTSATQSAVSSASAGDTVCMSAGTYGRVTLQSIAPSGTVTLQPAPGAKVTLGGVTLTGPSNTKNITVQGFYMTGSVQGLCGITGGVVFQYNTIQNVSGDFGFYFYANGCGNGHTQSGVAMLNNQIDHVGDCLTIAGGSGIEKNFTFNNNVCGPGIGKGATTSTDPSHYIEVGGIDTMTVNNNAFEGPMDANYINAQLHNNVFHIFGGGNDVDFSNNIVWRTQSRAQTILWQEGGYSNVTVDNNLILEDPNCFQNTACYTESMEIYAPHGMTVTNNTVQYTGLGLRFGETCGNGCSASGNTMTLQNNIVEPSSGQAANYAIWNCASACVADHNISADSSAIGTSSIKNWTPAYTTTSWTPVNGESYTAPPTGYYVATGSAAGLGWDGQGGPKNGIGAVAFNGGGTTTPPSDTMAPTVTVTAPANGATVSGQVPLTATASDNTGVSKVEFYADGTLLSTDTTSPYTASWDATNATAGSHTITAKAYDAANNMGSDTNTVNVAPAGIPAALVLDTGGFESGTLNNWNISGVGDVVPTIATDQARNGTKSARVVLTGNQNRSELSLGGNGTASTNGSQQFYPGDDRYYAFSFYINQMVYGQPGGHNLIMQLKGNDQLSPELALTLWDYVGDKGDGSDGGKGLWISDADSDHFVSPLSEKRWHDVVIHFKTSNTGTGSYQIFLDGQQVDSRNNVNTIPSGTPYGYIKTGLYRNGSTVSGTSDIRIDDGKLGTTYAAVAETSPLPADDADPTISFSSPANGATVSGTVTATATASDNTAVSKVEFSLDGTLKMTDTGSPYNYSFDSKTLTNGSHTLSAKAYDAAGNTKTTTITITVSNSDITAPNAPTGLNATAPNPTTVNLTWNAAADTGSNPSGVTKYNVLRNGVVIAQPTGTSYTDTGRTANTTYSYVVQAVDGANNVSASSASDSVTTPGSVDTTPPSVPVGVTATAASINQVNLSWSTSTDSGGSGIAGYNVYRGGTKLNGSLVTSTSYGDTTVDDDTNYSYRIEAVDGAGNKSAQSTAVTVRTPAIVRGDITGAAGTPDGKIDLYDISYVIRNYNTANSNGDISGPSAVPDGKINLYDISFVIRNYGP